MPPIDGDRTTSAPAFNPQSPATWLKPDEPLIGADDRDWSWVYVWHRDIPDFPGYKVGFDGSYWTCKVRCSGACSGDWKPMRLTPASERGGYLYVNLWNQAHLKRFRAHRLVLEAFWGPCPDGMETFHRDDDPTNNHFDNLKWDTCQANADQREARDRGCRGRRHWNVKLHPEDIPVLLAYRRAGATTAMVAEAFEISKTHAKRLCRGESWRREFQQSMRSIHGEDDPVAAVSQEAAGR